MLRRPALLQGMPLEAFGNYTKNYSRIYDAAAGTEIEPGWGFAETGMFISCLLYTSPSPRDATLSRMPSSA